MFHDFTAKNSVIWTVITLILINYVIFTEAENHRSNGSQNKPAVEKMCTSKLADGYTYSKPCNLTNTTEKIEEGHIAPVTDTEVADLNHHSVTENPQNIKQSPQPLNSIDLVVKPEEKLNNNTRFNITTGGIAALTCVSIAVVFYIGIMLWKHIVMNGYNNREILLNDEDIGDINDEDMRHFEAACIQIEA